MVAFKDLDVFWGHGLFFWKCCNFINLPKHWRCADGIGLCKGVQNWNLLSIIITVNLFCTNFVYILNLNFDCLHKNIWVWKRKKHISITVKKSPFEFLSVIQDNDVIEGLLWLFFVTCRYSAGQKKCYEYCFMKQKCQL